MPPSPSCRQITEPPSSVPGAWDSAERSGLAERVVLALLRGYKLSFSLLFTGACRYQPSCADYMAEAVRVHGSARGVWLGLRRLSRCHPLGGHGVDPVPPRGR